MISNNGKIFINWRRVKVWRRKHQYLLLPFLIGFVAGFILGKSLIAGAEPTELLNPCPDNACFITPTEEPLKIEPTTSPKAPKRPTSGKASYYSVAGCIGCDADRIMANGQRLDDARPTVAYNHLPLNTLVKITNTANGKTITVPVTDRGGFEKYGKIADLSLATKNALGCGDICNITITDNT